MHPELNCTDTGRQGMTSCSWGQDERSCPWLVVARRSCCKELRNRKPLYSPENIMRTNRYNKLTVELCEYAVIEYFRHKWTRHDNLEFIEKVVGIPRQQMELAVTSDYRSDLVGEAIEGVGLFLYGIAFDLIYDGIEPEDFMEEVTVSRRKDGATGKERDIATLCIMHQLLEHLVKIMLEPLLDARITQVQHASIPGRGQTSMKGQIHHYLAAGSIDTEVAAKTDVVHAYENTMYSLCIQIVKMESPRAKEAIALLEYLAKLAPGGHLIIGGYLDAWLFNLVASYAIRFMQNQGRQRREKFTKDISKVSAYMDDFVILAKTKSGIERVVRKTRRFMNEHLGLDIVMKVEPVSTTRLVDAAGYQIGKNHCIIRRTNWKRIRKVLIRAAQQMKDIGTLRIEVARKVISYNGYFQQTNSYKLQEKYEVAKLMRMARRVVRFHGWLYRRRRKERNNALRIAVNAAA